MTTATLLDASTDKALWFTPEQIVAAHIRCAADSIEYRLDDEAGFDVLRVDGAGITHLTVMLGDIPLASINISCPGGLKAPLLVAFDGLLGSQETMQGVDHSAILRLVQREELMILRGQEDEIAWQGSRS